MNLKTIFFYGISIILDFNIFNTDFSYFYFINIYNCLTNLLKFKGKIINKISFGRNNYLTFIIKYVQEYKNNFFSHFIYRDYCYQFHLKSFLISIKPQIFIS
jgi:hypothetical protein